MRAYIDVPPNSNWRNVDFHGAEAKAVLTWLRKQRQGAARQGRFAVCRTRDHRGVHVRITVKLLARLRRDLKLYAA